MRTSRPGTRTFLAGCVALAFGLTACGDRGTEANGRVDGGGTGAAARTTPKTTAAGPTTSFRTLANAVCRAEVSAVPPVPEAQTTEQRRTLEAATRRYVAAVRDAAGGLADAFVLLERRRPESQDALGPLVTKARAVVRAAGSAGRPTAAAPAGAAGIDDELRVTIALLNEASSAAGLPTCAL